MRLKFIIAIFFALAVTGGIIIFFSFDNYNDFVGLFSTPKPLKTLSAESSYPSGTLISLYENAPPGFPRGIILESGKPAHSNTVQTAEGQKQISLSYYSTKDRESLTEAYKKSLTKNFFNIQSTQIITAANVAIISANKDSAKLIITISEINTPDASKKVLISFQYQI